MDSQADLCAPRMDNLSVSNVYALVIYQSIVEAAAITVITIIIATDSVTTDTTTETIMDTITTPDIATTKLIITSEATTMTKKIPAYRFRTEDLQDTPPVSYTHLTLPTTPYV